MKNLISFLSISCVFGLPSLFGASELFETRLVSGGEFYEVRVTANLSAQDATNSYAVGAIYFRFMDGDRKVRADDTLISNNLKQDRYTALEFLFPHQAYSTGAKHKWVFQFRVPYSASKFSINVRPWNRVSNADFRDLSVRKAIQPYFRLGKKIRFLSEPFDDVCCVKGCVLDESGRPASNVLLKGVLSGVKADSYEDGACDWFSDVKFYAKSSNLGVLDCQIDFPSKLLGGDVSLVAVHSNQVLSISNLVVYSSFKPKILPSRSSKRMLTYNIVASPRDILKLDLDFVGSDDAMPDKRGAILSIRFMNEEGKIIHSPFMPLSKTYGDYCYIPTKAGRFKFLKDIRIPADVVSLTMSISSFTEKKVISLDSFMCNLKISDLEVPFSGVRENGPIVSNEEVSEIVKKWVGGEEAYSAIYYRDDNPVVDLTHADSILGRDYKSAQDQFMLELSFFPKVSLKGRKLWDIDPFESKTWQMNMSTCYWIPFQGLMLRQGDYYSHCKKWWQSFHEANFYPRKANKMVYVDHCCAARIEALLLTMYGHKPDKYSKAVVPSLLQELRKDESFFTTLMYQLFVDVSLVEYYLRSKLYEIHNHNLLMARSLMTFSKCFPYPFARRYEVLAKEVIKEHLFKMFEPDGFVREQSTKYHHWMTLHFLDLYHETAKLTPTTDGFFECMKKLIAVDVSLETPVGESVPMGDGAVVSVRNDLRFSALQDYRGSSLLQMPLKASGNTVLRESGLYGFRNKNNDRYLLLDISDVLKAHGHRDWGNWSYMADGITYITELGGPYKYGTQYARDFCSSESHSLVAPVGYNQVSGVGFNVAYKVEKRGNFMVKACSNVYGPDVKHQKKITGRGDLSAFLVEDEFISDKPIEYAGRLVLGSGISAFCTNEDSNEWELIAEEGKSIRIRIHGANSVDTKVINRKATWEVNKLTPVQTLVYKISSKGSCTTAVEVLDD